jgi:hypothetical protein
MVSETPALPAAKRVPVFVLSCWALGLIAFTQLLVAGMALATRLRDSQQVKTLVKEVPKLVVVRVPTPSADAENASPMVSRPPVEGSATHWAETTPLPPPTPMITPQVADPVSERLLKDARQARVGGDMGLAIMKLEAALDHSPDDPSVHYELGLVHEQMGVFDTAAAHYEKVYLMGTDAGALYPLAAAKVREGMVKEDFLGKLSLGRVRIFKDPHYENGQRVILTIPVQKAPAETINQGDLSVEVIFFNRTSNGEILQLEDKSWVSDKWTTEPIDWADGDESLRITYSIPEQDPSTAHLFGEKTYYGQVVTLLYKGEVLDVQAWPRDLAARIPRASGNSDDSVLPEFQDSLPPDFDPNLPLLPQLPEE